MKKQSPKAVPLKTVTLTEAFDLGSINANGTDIKFTASQEERARVLGIVGIVAIERLEGTVKIKPWHKTGFMLEGEIQADVVQQCVVTLEPAPETVKEPFQRTFIPETEANQDEPDEDVEVDFILEAEDPPDILVGHTINLLEVIAEHLALGLEPWPRKQGAQIDKAYRPGDDDDKAPNPFDVLKSLKH